MELDARSIESDLHDAALPPASLQSIYQMIHQNRAGASDLADVDRKCKLRLRFVN